MILEVETAISAVCLVCPEHPQHLVSHGAWQHPPAFLDPTGALVNVTCLPAHAHTQMLIARSRAGGTLDLAGPTGTSQLLQLSAEVS